MAVEVAVPPAASVTGLGAKFTVRPVGGVIVAERLTAPANPWAASVPDGWLPSVSVADPVEPELKLTVDALDDMLKSCSRTVKTTCLVLVKLLSVPDALVVTV